MSIPIFIVTEQQNDNISSEPFISMDSAVGYAAHLALEYLGGDINSHKEILGNYQSICGNGYEISITQSSIDFIPITLNTFDDAGNVVDTTTMGLSLDAISDIIDHAAQLIIVKRDGGDTSDVLLELEEALQTADVRFSTDKSGGL